MTEEVTAAWSKIMEDGAASARYHMRTAKDEIDALFGDGYAAEHPELIAAFMATAVADANQASLNVAAQKIRDGLYAISIELGV